MIAMWRALRSVLSLRNPVQSPYKRLHLRAVNVAELRELARKRLPRSVFNYIDGGAEDEITLKANTDALRNWEFAPRTLIDVSHIDTSITLLGKKIPFPLILAPTGFTRIVEPDGELAVARAAARSQTPYCLSTVGTRSIEEIARVQNGLNWFQLYMFRDRGIVHELIQRASTAGYHALMVTVDTPVAGRRERDVRFGVTLPPRIGLQTIMDGIRHPRWTWSFVRSEPILFSNLLGHFSADGATPVALADYMNSQFDPSVTWKDVEWLRKSWEGPLIIKGILTTNDARLAADYGFDAIVLSNHGGRQLDNTVSPLHLVVPVVDALGDKITVIYDGGIRRGSDMVKAISMGAHACMTGRAYLYGLGAGGELGVEYAIHLLRKEMNRTMALLGCPTIEHLNRSFLTSS